VYTFDAMPLRQLDLHDRANTARVWDAMHVLAALQGLANRYAPQLYLFYCTGNGIDTDRFWLDWLRGEGGWRGAAVHAGVATCGERDLPRTTNEAADAIARDAAKGSEPVFLWKRSILRRPSWYSDLSRALKARYPQLAIEVVDPYTFFGLIKVHLGGHGLR
jgi:hypothetical protein